MTDERCEAQAEANEYYPAATRCERPKGHEGAHRTTLGDFSVRMWDEISFPLNFPEPKAIETDLGPCDQCHKHPLNASLTVDHDNPRIWVCDECRRKNVTEKRTHARR